MSQLPVKDLSQISEFDGSLNQFIVQATAGTKIMAINVLANAFVKILASAGEADSAAGIRNGIYRGKNLGDTLTEAQSQSIRDGVFDDMFIGDYWLINGIHWRIAAFDYWMGCGDTKCTTHHVVIVPDEQLTTSYMNSTNVTTTAYYNSYMRQTTIPAVVETVKSAFSASHILTIRHYLKNAATNGYETAGAWYDSLVDLMNEAMVYGGKMFENAVQGTNFAAYYTISKSQLPLFRLRHDLIVRSYHWWLQDVAAAATFANVNSSGVAHHDNASHVFGVRPAFAIY